MARGGGGGRKGRRKNAARAHLAHQLHLLLLGSREPPPQRRRAVALLLELSTIFLQIRVVLDALLRASRGGVARRGTHAGAYEAWSEVVTRACGRGVAWRGKARAGAKDEGSRTQEADKGGGHDHLELVVLLDRQPEILLLLRQLLDKVAVHRPRLLQLPHQLRPLLLHLLQLRGVLCAQLLRRRLAPLLLLLHHRRDARRLRLARLRLEGSRA